MNLPQPRKSVPRARNLFEFGDRYLEAVLVDLPSEEPREI
jgi:hypothetical protein